MKRSWSNLVLFVCLTGLLVVIGGLQYRWLSRINESDGEKARKRVSEQAERFAADFNREIQGSYFNFQTDAATWRTGDWAQFNERYDFWREKASYPDLIRDFYADHCEVRLLEVQCDFSDDYLIGHARRVGLAGQATPETTLQTLLPTVRFDVRFESDRIRDADFSHLHHMRQSQGAEDNARALAAFLSIPFETARDIAATDHLFAD